MTVVNVTAALTALGGSEPVTSGRITVEYLRGKNGEPATRADGAAVTLPAPIVIAIVDGSPVAPVDVPPTDGTCYARIWVECRVPRDAGILELPAVAIPAMGPVDITALVAVDPASFEPVTTVVAAWQLAVGQVAAMQTDVTAKSAQAVLAAADAGTFAGAADFDADRAGLSAFAAGQSAASARGHKNDASTSAGAAAGSATEAQTARTGAETARTGAETAATAAGTARTGAETAQTGAQTARTGAETAKTAAEAARDAAQAATFAGTTPAAGTSLDALTTPGMYRITYGATVAQGAPFESFYGTLMVVPRAGGAVTQIAYKHNALSADSSQNWQRTQTGGGWGAWFAYSAVLWEADGTRGRTLKMWDPINGRWNLIYGDTGTRDVTALVTWPSGVSITSGSRVLMRRVLWDVTVWIEEGLEASGPVASAAMVMLPSGFVPNAQGDTSPIYMRNNLSQVGMVQTLITGQMSIAFSGATGAGANTRFRHTFKTANAWPSTLPGSAFGTIPIA